MTSERAMNSADDLRDQLRAADVGDGGGARMSRSADYFGRRFASVVALLLAAYLLVVIYIYPEEVMWLDLTVTTLFVASMVGATLWYRRQRFASSRGWSKRYSVGFTLSLGLFGVGIALAGVFDSRELWVWLPYAALTAAPLVVAGLLRAPR